MGTCVDYADKLGEWPNCTTADCPNKTCLHLNSKKCWPCTIGVPIDWASGLSRIEREAKSRRLEAAYLQRQEI